MVSRKKKERKAQEIKEKKQAPPNPASPNPATPKGKKVTIQYPSPKKESKGYIGKGKSASKRKNITSTEGETYVESQPSSKKQHTVTETPLEDESGLIKEPVPVTQSQNTTQKLMGTMKSILKTKTNTPANKPLENPKTPMKSSLKTKSLDTRSYKPTPKSTPCDQKRPSESQQIIRTPFQFLRHERPLDRPVEGLIEVNRSRSRERPLDRHMEVPLGRPRVGREETYMFKRAPRDWF